MDQTKYEITFIVDENATDEIVKSAIEEAGAKIVSETEVGVRKFTYPIKKKESGKYFAIEFETDGETLRKIDQALRIEKTVIRYLIIKALRKPLVLKRSNRDANGNEIKTTDSNDKTPDTSKTTEAVKPVEKQAEPTIAATVGPEEVTIEEIVENKPEELDQQEIKQETEAEIETPEVKPAKTEPKAKPAAKKKTAKAVKMSVEELDEKLAELVSED